MSNFFSMNPKAHEVNPISYEPDFNLTLSEPQPIDFQNQQILNIL